MSFTDDLEMSHSYSDAPWWEEVYRAAFPTFSSMTDHRQNGEHQRAGIDRSITLANAKQLLIDEKVRGRNRKTGRVYEDIALEYLSDRDRGAPGWVCKPLRADFIAYAIAPLGRCYLLPVIQLQAAWDRRKDEWLSEYRTIEAQNDWWVTLSLCVPVEVLFPAIGSCLRVEFTPAEVQDI
jgi:hypothetical protein